MKYSNGCYSKVFTEIPQSGAFREWCEGMISGNGEQGYITSGAPYSDTFIFQNMFFIYPNDCPREVSPELINQLHDARQAVFNMDDTWRMTQTDQDGNVIDRIRERCYTFHPAQQLRIKSLDKSEIVDYVRWTDYDSALTGVHYTDTFGTWERTAFTSRADRVSVIRMTESTTGHKINVDVSIDSKSGMGKADIKPEFSLQRYKKFVDDNCSYIGEVAHYPDFKQSELKNGGYAGITMILTDGEKMFVDAPDCVHESINQGEYKNPTVRIKNASEVILITNCGKTENMCTMDEFAGKKNYKIIDDLLSHVKSVADKYTHDGKFDYQSMLDVQIEIQSKEFGALSIKIGDGNSTEDLSNEELIAIQKDSRDSLIHGFVERAYSQGRYAQICSSGYSAPRLYGMWTGEWAPEWRSAYTLDANVNLQVAPMNVGNLSYTPIGYLNFILRNVPDWLKNAAASYGMHDAMLTGINSDGDRCMSIEYDNSYPFCYWNAGVSWCLMPLFEYWQCYGNKKIEINPYMKIQNCKNVLGVHDGGLSDSEMEEMIDKGWLDLESDVLLPLLTKQANFWEQICTPQYYTDANGEMHYDRDKTQLDSGETYIILPGYSPENHPLNFESRLGANVTMDISAAIYGLDMVIALEKAVKRDGYTNAVEKWELLKSRLPKYKLDDDGALCEWCAKGYKENNNHRHISHLYPAWPAFETQNNDGLTRAVEKAIENRNKFNFTDITSGHGWLHRALVEARLKHGNNAESSVAQMAGRDTYFTSMMTDHDNNRRHDSYCTDMSIGLTAVINEMLVLSDAGFIQLLPAIADSWTAGSVRGMITRAGAEILSLDWDLTKGKITAEIKSLKDHNSFTVSCGISAKNIYINNSAAESGTAVINANKNEVFKFVFEI